MCFPYLARDKWWDRNFENCFEIRPVTRSEKYWFNPKFEDNDLKSGCYRISKLPPLSVNYVCPISHETNHPIMILKIVLKSVLWRGLESAWYFCIFQLLCFSLHPTVYKWSRFFLRTGRDERMNQPKVVQEVLADLKKTKQKYLMEFSMKGVGGSRVPLTFFFLRFSFV